jgi:hypothetical protein
MLLKENNFQLKYLFFLFSSQLCDLGNGIMINIKTISSISDIHNPNKYSPDLLDDNFLVSKNVFFYYLPEYDVVVQNMAKEFLKMSVFENRSFKLNMICRNQQLRYYLKVIKIRKPMIYDLALHYGPNFVNIHDKIIKELTKKEGKGIVLLHGIPGSGKLKLFLYDIHPSFLFI